MDDFSLLKDWALVYVRQKDVVRKSIKSVEDTSDGFKVIEESKAVAFVILPFFDESVLDKDFGSGSFNVIVLNSVRNLNFLISNWKFFSSFRNLCIFFVNPKSLGDSRWIVCPFTHSGVADKFSLSKGLNSLFEQVDPWV